MKRLALIIGSLIACLPAGVLADADSSTVDCARGESIADALQKKKPDRPLTVVVRGACMEGVVIDRDGVSLIGDGGSINGSVTVAGAHRVVLADLAITNPVGDGVTVTDNASVTIRGNQINDSSGYGVVVRNGSFAQVNDNHMLRNGLVNSTNVDASGLSVGQNSTVRGLRNEMRENLNTGVEVFEGSLYRSERDIIAQRTAAGRSAIDTYRRGHVEVRGATVSGVVFVGQQSHLQARNLEDVTTRMAGPIEVSGLSFFRLRAGVVRQGSLACSFGFAVCICDGLPGGVCPPLVP